MTLELGILIVVVSAIVFFTGYSIGHKDGYRVLVKTLVAGFERNLHAAQYWQDRARLAEQKCCMLTTKAADFIIDSRKKREFSEWSLKLLKSNGLKNG